MATVCRHTLGSSAGYCSSGRTVFVSRGGRRTRLSCASSVANVPSNYTSNKPHILQCLLLYHTSHWRHRKGLSMYKKIWDSWILRAGKFFVKKDRCYKMAAIGPAKLAHVFCILVPQWSYTSVEKGIERYPCTCQTGYSMSASFYVQYRMGRQVSLVLLGLDFSTLCYVASVTRRDRKTVWRDQLCHL